MGGAAGGAVKWLMGRARAKGWRRGARVRRPKTAKSGARPDATTPPQQQLMGSQDAWLAISWLAISRLAISWLAIPWLAISWLVISWWLVISSQGGADKAGAPERASSANPRNRANPKTRHVEAVFFTRLLVPSFQVISIRVNVSAVIRSRVNGDLGARKEGLTGQRAASLIGAPPIDRKRRIPWSVSRFLRKSAIFRLGPGGHADNGDENGKRYVALMVANALAILGLDLEQGDGSIRKEIKRLRELLNLSSSEIEDSNALRAEAEALNHRLVRAIRSGVFASSDARLQAHLLATTCEKLAASNPKALGGEEGV